MPKLRAHHKVWLVGATFAVGSLALLGITSAQLGAEKRVLVERQQRDIPDQERLVGVGRSLSTARGALADAVLSTDPTQRVALLQRSLDESNAAAAAWRAFTDDPPRLPGERARRARFDDAAAAADGSMGQAAGLAIVDAAAGVAVTETAPVIAVMHLIDAQLAELTPLQNALRDTMTADRATEVRNLADAQREGLLAFAASILVGLAVTVACARSVRRQEQTLRDRERERAESARSNEFDARFGRALEMARTETRAFEIVEQALSEAAPAEPAELLLADSSRAHFRRVLTTAPDSEGCAVATPGDCPAAQGGATLVFPSNGALDACPHLRDLTAPCSAVCLPVTVGSQAVGVIHVTAADGAPPAEGVLGDLRLVARKTGDRVGMLRAFADSEAQARTDPLTGLLNRRSVENRVRDLVAAGTPYVVAFGDLDRFKELNDTHGHETGDRALRLFARVLRDTIRPGDVPARYGGEEFLVVLPDCTVSDAISVVERVREQLTLALAAGAVPRFTASFGVAAAGPTDAFEDVVASADAALFAAKRAGRNRVVRAPEPTETDTVSQTEPA